MSQDEENAVKNFLENPDLVEKLLPYLDVFTVILLAESPVPATSLPFGCLASRGSWGSPWFFVLVAVLLHEKEKENKSGFHKMRLDWLSLTKIYWFGIIHLTFDIFSIDISQHLTFVIDIPWHLTFDIFIIVIPWQWYAMTFDIWNWYTMTFDIWHLTFDIWHLTFDIWHLTWLKVLTALALILMTLAQSYHIFTGGFWGYLSNRGLMGQWPRDITGLRDASASKNDPVQRQLQVLNWKETFSI